MDDRRPDWEERLNTAVEALSDADQTHSDNEQTLAERDQQASDDEQAVAGDRDRGAATGVSHPRPSAAGAEAAREREPTSGLHDRTARERDLSARRRDELSMLRARVAEGHDEEAVALDAKDDLADSHTLRVEELRERGRESRARAAGDRALAARDRQHAARDGRYAARDREQAGYDREHAGTDELTGARRQGVGLEELGSEMERARREGNSLVAAYVDVDGLKSVNDEHGHAAGDELLKTVAEGLRHHMRSYDLLARLGGDEFLCALPNITLAEARHRFVELRAELKDSAGSSVSVGFSELLDGDSLNEFVNRADRDLMTSRTG